MKLTEIQRQMLHDLSLCEDNESWAEFDPPFPLLPGSFSRPGVVRYTCTRRALVVRPPCDGLTPPPPPLIQPYRLEDEWRAATWTLRAS
jgi:hypothetical protein